MKTVLNILWLVLAGLWLAISYVFAAVLLAITIIGLPFAKQALKLAGYALWPFGRTLVQSSTRHKGISVVGNVLWFVLAGWWLLGTRFAATSGRRRRPIPFRVRGSGRARA